MPNFLDRFKKYTQISNFTTIRLVNFFMRTDGQADTTKVIVAFRNFANEPKNHLFISKFVRTESKKNKFLGSTVAGLYKSKRL
jgi:hypothetical protein